MDPYVDWTLSLRAPVSMLESRPQLLLALAK
jgi:hypothetical protein